MTNDVSRLTLNLPSEYLKTLKQRALDTGTNVSALVRQALEHYPATRRAHHEQ